MRDDAAGAEVVRGGLREAGDHVPTGPPTAEVVEGQQLACEAVEPVVQKPVRPPYGTAATSTTSTAA
ncbi:hypothetical protein GCM10027575_29300 [Phytohabitans suffuscus]